MLDNAATIICCDQAADRLIRHGREPDLIIGDMDSVSGETLEKYADRLVTITEQETNDLTKAVNHAADLGWTEVTILAATGLREDHALGNISLLLEYNRRLRATMVTDHGSFSVIESGQTIESRHGEKVSFFSVDNRAKVTSEGLKYPLKDMQLHNWWRASLNEVTEDRFTLHFTSDLPLILFRLRDDDPAYSTEHRR